MVKVCLRLLTLSVQAVPNNYPTHACYPKDINIWANHFGLTRYFEYNQLYLNVTGYFRSKAPYSFCWTTQREKEIVPWKLELITFEILAAERLRLMGFDNRLIIDCFANVENILIWLFSSIDRFRSEKYESNYQENPFPEMKGVNLLSKTHCNDKSNLKPKNVLQE